MYCLGVFQKRSEKRTRDRMLEIKVFLIRTVSPFINTLLNSASRLHDRNSYDFDSVSNFLQHDDNTIVQQEKTNSGSQLKLHPLIAILITDLFVIVS